MRKIKQMMALAGVVLIIGLVLLTLYCAVTGSPYFLASFVAMLVVPLLLYAYMFIYRLLKSDKMDIKKKEKNMK